jgi:ABC-2 type transport system permease protein
MRVLAKLSWVEIKLFVREPITMVFTFALPLLFLFVMGGVFGNTPDPDVYRGVGPMDFYVSAYIGLVAASIGLVALPVHLTAYRERGVLRRLRASSFSVWSLFGSQVIVSLVIAVIGGILITVASRFVYDAALPASPWLVIAAFLVSLLGFAAIGVLLGAVLPTTRAAQGLGLLLFFVILILGGAGPPKEVLTDPMRIIGDVTPLSHVITLMQDPWLGFGWNNTEFLIVLGFMAASIVLSARFFRWE